MGAIGTGNRIGLELALRFQRFRRHHHYRGLPAAGHFLTILAVTVVSGNYLFAIELIAGVAAKACAHSNFSHSPCSLNERV
jgi:hypothetical protein